VAGDGRRDLGDDHRILSGQEEVEEALNRLNEDLAPILAAENG
jgi:hypothetical protein